MFKYTYIYSERVWSHFCKNKHVYTYVDADKEKSVEEHTTACFHSFDRHVFFKQLRHRPKFRLGLASFSQFQASNLSFVNVTFSVNQAVWLLLQHTLGITGVYHMSTSIIPTLLRLWASHLRLSLICQTNFKGAGNLTQLSPEPLTNQQPRT